MPKVLNTEIYDEILPVTEEDAYAAGRQIGRTEGVLVGISSGAALWAAIQVAKRPENQGKRIVVLLPRHGRPVPLHPHVPGDLIHSKPVKERACPVGHARSFASVLNRDDAYGARLCHARAWSSWPAGTWPTDSATPSPLRWKRSGYSLRAQAAADAALLDRYLHRQPSFPAPQRLTA